MIDTPRTNAVDYTTPDTEGDSSRSWRAAYIDMKILAERLERELTVERYERARFAAMFDLAVKQLCAIKSFAHPDGIVVNGKGYSFHPPDLLVREAWEALSKAIRDIDVEALAKQ